MEKNLPGKNGVERLLFYPGAVERGEVVPPVHGIIRGTPGGDECVIPLGIVTNVVPIDTGDTGPPAVEVRILVSADQPWLVKTGKDARGKPVFLRSFDD